MNFKFALEELYLSDSFVIDADFNKMPNMKVLFVDGTPFKNINLSSNAHLTHLRYNYRQCRGFEVKSVKVELVAQKGNNIRER